MRSTCLLAQSSLTQIFGVEEFRQLDLPVQVSTNLLSDLAAGRHPVVMALALNEQQLDVIASIARDHPLTATIAVVSDLTGQRTQLALNAGASWVLNTVARREDSFTALRPLVRLHLDSSTEPPPNARLGGKGPNGAPRPHVLQFRLGPKAAGGPAQRPPQDGPPGGTVGGHPGSGPEQSVDVELVQMLCGPSRTSDIARHFYCSERSMYRRIRALYQQLGVETRQELRQWCASQRPWISLPDAADHAGDRAGGSTAPVRSDA
jgi:DNA-binding NarL/FixJ family response regulator